MTPKLYLSIISISCQLMVCAQSKVKFATNNSIGLLAGSSTSSWQLQTVNGVRYKSYSVGVGVGVDHYYFKTVPVFVDVRKNIYNSEQTAFVYLDAGTNFPAKKDASTSWQKTSYHGGVYYDVGFGYKWTLVKRVNVNASFGYSQKRYSTREQYLNVGMDPGVAPDRYDYRLRRFSIKFGLGL